MNHFHLVSLEEVLASVREVLYMIVKKQVSSCLNYFVLKIVITYHHFLEKHSKFTVQRTGLGMTSQQEVARFV